MKNKRANFKIIAASFVTIFSMAVVFVATAAWFTAARAVNNAADGFDVVCNSEIVEEIEIHELAETANDTEDNPYLYNYSYVGKYTFDDPKTNKLTYHKNTADTAGIGKYSLFEREKTLLMLYKFRTDIKDEMFNKLVFIANNKTNKEDSILEYDSTAGKPKKELAQNNNQLSSIIKFSVLPLTTLPSSNINIDYSTYKTYITSNEKSFATINTSSDDALTDYKDSLTLFSSTDGTKYAGLALILSYNSDALEYLFNINLGNDVLDNVGDDPILFNYVDFSLVL